MNEAKKFQATQTHYTEAQNKPKLGNDIIVQNREIIDSYRLWFLDLNSHKT